VRISLFAPFSNLKIMAKNTNCPYCKKPVTLYSEETSGTVTDNQERRWHKDCTDKLTTEEYNEFFNDVYGSKKVAAR